MMGVLTKNNGALWVQSFAGEVLCKLKVKDAFEPCLTLLEKSKNSFGTYTLPEAFGPLAGESFVEQLKAELKSPTGRHYGALRALAYANSPELAPDVMPFLEDKDWAIRQQAVITLGKMKYAKAVPTLVKMLGNNQENMYGRDIPGALLGALGDIGDKSAVEPLLEAMEKNSRPNFSGHLAATARALGQLRDKRAYEPLMRAARTYPEAAQGLALLGDRRAIEQLQITGAWAYGSAALIVAKALFDLEPQACVDTAGRLIHNSPGFDLAKVDAVRLLAKVGNAKAIEYIKLALRDDNLLVRKEARDALAKLRGGAVVPPPTTAPAP
jgi:HEAT repeat protein